LAPSSRWAAGVITNCATRRPPQIVRNNETGVTSLTPKTMMFAKNA